MAKDAVGKFVEAINKSPDLLARCKGVIQKSTDASGFAALGKENGFHFTSEEAMAHFEEVLKASQPGDPAAMGDEALGAVSGGFVPPGLKGGQSQVRQSVLLFRGLGGAPPWSFRR
jgi:hypothetical protein